MASRTLFPARVVTPEGVAFEGDVQEAYVTSISGGMGILDRRAPVVADLRVGTIRLLLPDDTWRTWASAEGFAQASSSLATIVVEEAVDAADIDPAAAAEITSEARARAAAPDADDHARAAAEKAAAWGEHLAAVQQQYA